VFGDDYKPDPYIEDTYQIARKHEWYIEPRMVTVNTGNDSPLRISM
jgi:hypothetical protein